MKQLITLFAGHCLLMTACHKSQIDDVIVNPADTTIIANGVDTGLAGNYKDTGIIRAGDKITYEVITTDTTGWFGIWNDSTGRLTSNGLDSITYGSPNLLPSGWRYSFICPNKPFQALISVVSNNYWQQRTKVNLYKNDHLIQSYSDNIIPAAARLIATAATDTLTGTSSHPVLTYEVIIDNNDTSLFQHDAWFGQWTASPEGKMSDYYDPLLSSLAIPSGWRYSFYPDALPFIMAMGVRPITSNMLRATIHFYVNGQLVKTTNTQTSVYANNCSYVVQ